MSQQINKKQFASIISTLALVAIGAFGLGYDTGKMYQPEEVNHSVNYNWEAPDEKHNFDPQKTVTYTGTLNVGGYTMHFLTENQSKALEGPTIGFTFPQDGKKEIWIQTNRPAADIEETCDHEVFHELFPQFRHPEGTEKFTDPIYTYSDDANIAACDLAVEIALENQ